MAANVWSATHAREENVNMNDTPILQLYGHPHTTVVSLTEEHDTHRIQIIHHTSARYTNRSAHQTYKLVWIDRRAIQSVARTHAKEEGACVNARLELDAVKKMTRKIKQEWQSCMVITTATKTRKTIVRRA